MEGALETKGSSLLGKWGQQYFRIADGLLLSYDAEDSERQRPLQSVALAEVTSLARAEGSRELVFDHAGQRMRLRAKTEEEARAWFQLIERLAAAGPSKAEVPGSLDFFLQVHSLYNLPTVGDQPQRYMVRAAWQGGRDFAVTEEREGTRDPGSQVEDCKVLQQLMLTKVPGVETLEVGIWRRAPRGDDESWECIGKCLVSATDPRHQKAGSHRFYDWDGSPSQVTAKMKVKAPAEQVKAAYVATDTGRPPEEPFVPRQPSGRSGRSLSTEASAAAPEPPRSPSPSRRSIVDPAVLQAEASLPAFARSTASSHQRRNPSPSRDRSRPGSPGGGSRGRDPEAPRDNGDFARRRAAPLAERLAAKVEEWHSRHAEKLQRAASMRELQEAAEEAELEWMRQQRLAKSKVDMSTIDPVGAAGRLYQDAKAQQLRLAFLEEKHRAREREALEKQRARPKGRSRSAAAELGGDRKDRAVKHTEQLHAMHKAHIDRHNARLLAKDVETQMKLEGSQIYQQRGGGQKPAVCAKVSQAKVDAMHYVAELRREWREEEQRLALEEESRAICRKCICGNWLADGDTRCKLCFNPAYQPPEEKRRHDLQVSEKLYEEYKRKVEKQKNHDEGRDERVAERIRSMCGCGAELKGEKRCKACHAESLLNKEDREPVEIEKSSERLHSAAKHQAKKFEDRRAKQLKETTKRLRETCGGCGEDLSQNKDERCSRCGTLRRGLRSAEEEKPLPPPDDWVRDRLVAPLVTAVVARCGYRPEKASKAFSELAAPLQRATEIYRKAALHSRSKSVGFSELCKQTSMRCYGDGILMADTEGARQCCEPDPVRQLSEDLDDLMASAEAAQDVLLAKLAFGGRDIGAGPKHIRARWPSAGVWKKPGVTRHALFAYHAGVKPRISARQKALVLFGPAEGPRMYRHVMDFARASLVFPDCESLRRGLEDILSQFSVLDVRNYYHPACANVLDTRQVEVLVAVKSEEEGLHFPFVCEIRLEEQCFFEAREAARPHLETIYKGFRTLYDAASGKDLDAIEYTAKRYLHRPGDPHNLRLFRRQLAKRYGSPVAVFRSFLGVSSGSLGATHGACGNAKTIPFLQFREACCELDRRWSCVDFWRAMDPGLGGCLSLFELDPDAVSLLASFYLAFAQVDGRGEAVVERVLRKLAKGPQVQGLGLYSLDAFRAATLPLGFSSEDIRRAFGYLDMYRASKWSKPTDGACSAYITIKDIMWLMKLPDIVFLDAVTLKHRFTAPLTPQESKVVLGRVKTQQEASMSPVSTNRLDHDPQDSRGLRHRRLHRVAPEQLCAEYLLSHSVDAGAEDDGSSAAALQDESGSPGGGDDDGSRSLGDSRSQSVGTLTRDLVEGWNRRTPSPPSSPGGGPCGASDPAVERLPEISRALVTDWARPPSPILEGDGGTAVQTGSDGYREYSASASSSSRSPRSPQSPRRDHALFSPAGVSPSFQEAAAAGSEGGRPGSPKSPLSDMGAELFAQWAEGGSRSPSPKADGRLAAGVDGAQTDATEEAYEDDGPDEDDYEDGGPGSLPRRPPGSRQSAVEMSETLSAMSLDGLMRFHGLLDEDTEQRLAAAPADYGSATDRMLQQAMEDIVSGASGPAGQN